MKGHYICECGARIEVTSIFPFNEVRCDRCAALIAEVREDGSLMVNGTLHVESLQFPTVAGD